AAGMKRLGWTRRPHEMHKLQAAAAVGQMGLTQAYEDAFTKHGLHTAQILLTHDDLADRKRYLNARSTLTTLLKLGVIPIINENDTVVTDEIKFGDNDTLGALVANLIEADALVILTDQDGLYTADPRKHPDATLISDGRAEDPQYEKMAGGAGSGISKGGMLTKVKAAQRAARSGAHTLILGGRRPDALRDAAHGHPLGSLLHASSTPLQARKQWLADHLNVAGAFIVDAGAAAALSAGKSLLPVGILDVFGIFERGAVVACRLESGAEIARGLSSYSSAEAQKLKRTSSKHIEAILGYACETEAIHRDNLVLLPAS
ncbi:MAG: glutamate 5-kinase, partial [Rhodocyclaceae bacterium]|nr:glutamate 5-kinase [Rhodocyclaceae bacterium]